MDNLQPVTGNTNWFSHNECFESAGCSNCPCLFGVLKFIRYFFLPTSVYDWSRSWQFFSYLDDSFLSTWNAMGPCKLPDPLCSCEELPMPKPAHNFPKVIPCEMELPREQSKASGCWTSSSLEVPSSPYDPTSVGSQLQMKSTITLQWLIPFLNRAFTLQGLWTCKFLVISFRSGCFAASLPSAAVNWDETHTMGNITVRACALLAEGEWCVLYTDVIHPPASSVLDSSAM